jgi:purine-binding chemotaxis protein CheW
VTTRRPNRRSPVDWDLIKRRLAAAETVLERQFAPPAETRRAILHERALTLAAEPRAENAPEQEMELLEFALAQERYALETSCVQEVHTLKELTPLPCTPAFVRGIANIRGRITSVIDIKKFFDLPDRGLTDLNKAILLSDGHMHFGLLADSVIGVRRVPIAQIQPPLATLSGIRVDYLRGITAERLIVLDAGKLLKDRTIVIDQEVLL